MSEDIITCPKCGETSGNSWAQCKGSCPMPMSPHFDASLSTVEKARKRLVKAGLLKEEVA